MNIAAQRQSGFSLLEVLIAILILAGIAAALGPALSTTARATARIHEKAELEEEIRSLQAFFHNIVMQSIIFSTPENPDDVVASATHFAVSTLDPATQEPFVVEIDVPNADSSVLFTRIITAGHGENDAIILTTKLESAQFEYLDNSGQTQLWKSDWRSETLPSLIRFKGVLRNKNGMMREFMFESAPMARAPLTCNFDSVSRRCR